MYRINLGKNTFSTQLIVNEVFEYKKCFKKRSFNGTKLKRIFRTAKYFDKLFCYLENNKRYTSVYQIYKFKIIFLI